jgi:hypothetical protein
MGDFNDGNGGGQSLGGGGGGPFQLSPEEIRRRRLQTLERISATNRSPTPPALPRMIPLQEAIQMTAPPQLQPQSPPPSLPTSMTSSSSPLPPRPTPRVVTYVDRDDDDAELQAVLALSMAEATRKEDKPFPAAVDLVDDMDETDHDLQAALSLSLKQEEDSSGGPAEYSNLDIHASSNVPANEEATGTSTSSTTDYGDNRHNSLSNNGDSGDNRHNSLSNNGDSGPTSTGGAGGGGASSAATTSVDSSMTTTTVDVEGLSPAVAECYKSSEPCHVLDFHSVMWDSDRTTDNDKQRWLSQGINFRDFDPEGKLQRESAKDSVLADVISNHGPWGLTQAHGGPCGVLASLQAELLRLLLFGARDPLDYPTTLNVQYRKKSDLSNSLMLQGLAMSMALILARAALTPPAALEDRSNSSSNNNEGGATDHSNNTTDQGNNNNTSESSSSTSDCTNTVQIVLPIHPHNLGWEDFEPWYGNPANGSQSLALRTHSIAVPNTEDPSSSKRQKTNGSQEEQQQSLSQQQHPQSPPTTTAAGPTSQTLEDRILRLAHVVTAFLLEKPRGSEAPLQAFRKPGGVVLLVMSLAFSRGTRLVQSDMDDPSARLTSQFGHCGQELLNLLLTGQSGTYLFFLSSNFGIIVVNFLKSRQWDGGKF